MLGEALFGRVGGLPHINWRQGAPVFRTVAGQFDDVDRVGARAPLSGNLAFRHFASVSAGRVQLKRPELLPAYAAELNLRPSVPNRMRTTPIPATPLR